MYVTLHPPILNFAILLSLVEEKLFQHCSKKIRFSNKQVNQNNEQNEVLHIGTKKFQNSKQRDCNAHTRWKVRPLERGHRLNVECLESSGCEE